MNDQTRFALKWFCPCCFADEGSGSMDHLVIPTTTGCHCTNCGASGGVQLPSWAIERIRQSASWVGKRFYPNEEDIQAREERKALHELVSEWPGRVVDSTPHETLGWKVTQLLPNGNSVSTYKVAPDARTAARNCGLLYVPGF